MNKDLIFQSIVKKSATLPFVKVDRVVFLRKELTPYYGEEVIKNVISHGTGEYVDKKIIDKIALGCINYHTTLVCGTSALAGIPGGWAMAGTIPADLAQFYGHVIALTQKLIYLYGWPDITDEEGEIDDDTCSILILFIGLMMGEKLAVDGINTLLKSLGGQVEKRLARMALSEVGLYNLIQQVCKWIGVKVTKESFSKAAGKAIPLIGAPVSATLTYVTFKPMARRLKRKLDEQWALAHPKR